MYSSATSSSYSLSVAASTELDRWEAQLCAYKPQLRSIAAVDRQRLRQRLQQQLLEENGRRAQVQLPVLQVNELLANIERSLKECRRLGIFQGTEVAVEQEQEPQEDAEELAHVSTRRYELPTRTLQLSEASSSDENEDEDTRPLSVLVAHKPKKPRLSSPSSWERSVHGKSSATTTPRQQREDEPSEAEQHQQLVSRKRRASYKLISTSSSATKTRCWSEQQTTTASTASSPSSRPPIKTTLRADRSNGSAKCTYHVHVPSFAKECHISINLGNVVHDKLSSLYERVPQKEILAAPTPSHEPNDYSLLPVATTTPPLSPPPVEAEDDALSRLISEVLVEPNAIETWRATNALDNINNNLNSNYDLAQQFFDSSSASVATSVAADGNARPKKKRQRKNTTKAADCAANSPKAPPKKRVRKAKLDDDATGTTVAAKSDLAKYVELFANDCSQTQPYGMAGSMTPANSSTMSQQLVSSTTQNLDDSTAANVAAGSTAEQQHNQQQITHYLDGDWANGAPCQLVFTGSIPSIALDANQIQQEDFSTTTAPFEDFVNYFDCTNTNADNNVIARVLEGGNSVPLSIPLSAFSNIVQNPQTLPLSASTSTATTTSWNYNNNNNFAVNGQPLEWSNQRHHHPPHQSIIKITNDNTTFVTNIPILQQATAAAAPPPPAHSCEVILDLSKKPKPAGSLINSIRSTAASTAASESISVDNDEGDECLPLDLSVKSNSVVQKSQPQQQQKRNYAVETDDNFIRRLIETSDFDFGTAATNEGKTLQCSSSSQVVTNESFKAALDMPLLDIMDNEMSNFMQAKAVQSLVSSDVQNTSAEETAHHVSGTYNNHAKTPTDLFANMSESIEFPDQSTKTLFEQLLEVNNDDENSNQETFKGTANNNIYEPCAATPKIVACEAQNVNGLDNTVTYKNIGNCLQLPNEDEHSAKDQTKQIEAVTETELILNSSDETIERDECSKTESALADSLNEEDDMVSEHKEDVLMDICSKAADNDVEIVEKVDAAEFTFESLNLCPRRDVEFEDNNEISNSEKNDEMLAVEKQSQVAGKSEIPEEAEGVINLEAAAINEDNILKEGRFPTKPKNNTEAAVRTEPIVIISVESIKNIGSTSIEEYDAYIQRILKKARTSSQEREETNRTTNAVTNNNDEDKSNCAGTNENNIILCTAEEMATDLQTKTNITINEINDDDIEEKKEHQAHVEQKSRADNLVPLITIDLNEDSESADDLLFADMEETFATKSTSDSPLHNAVEQQNDSDGNDLEQAAALNTTNSNAKPNQNNNEKLPTEHTTNSTNINIDLIEVYNEENINLSIKMPTLMRLEHSSQESRHTCDFSTDFDSEFNNNNNDDDYDEEEELISKADAGNNDGVICIDPVLCLADTNNNDALTAKVQIEKSPQEETTSDSKQEISDDQFEFFDVTRKLCDNDDTVLDKCIANNTDAVAAASNTATQRPKAAIATYSKESALSAESTDVKNAQLFPTLSLLEMESQLEQLDFEDEFDDDAVSLATSCFDSNDEDASVDAKASATGEKQQAPSSDIQRETKTSPTPSLAPKTTTQTAATSTTNNATEMPQIFKKFKIPKLSKPSPGPPQQLVTPVAASAPTTTAETRKKAAPMLPLPPPPPPPSTQEINKLSSSEVPVKATSKFIGLEKLTRTVQNVCAVPPLPLISVAPPNLSLAPLHKRSIDLLHLPPPPLGVVMVTSDSSSSGGGVDHHTHNDDDAGEESSAGAFNSARHHADYAKLQRGFYAGAGGEGRNRGLSTLEIAKLFGITCLPFLADKCFALAACPLSHKLRDADILKSALERLTHDKAELSACYRFMYSHARLFRLYSGVFCKLYTQLNQRSKLLNMVNDCERYTDCAQTLRTIFYSLVQCGLNKVNACRQLLSRSRDKSKLTLDCLMSIIMEADWTMFCDHIDRFTQVPHYNVRINILHQMAPAALRSKDPHLVSVVFKCLLVLQPDDIGLVQRSRELIQLLELMKSGQVC